MVMSPFTINSTVFNLLLFAKCCHGFFLFLLFYLQRKSNLQKNREHARYVIVDSSAFNLLKNYVSLQIGTIDFKFVTLTEIQFTKELGAQFWVGVVTSVHMSRTTIQN